MNDYLSPVDSYLHGSWDALGNGAPMLVALAQLCSERWVNGRVTQLRGQAERVTVGTTGESETVVDASPSAVRSTLSCEAAAILFAARDRCIIEVRGVNSAFNAAARLLAVYIELSEERTIAFRDSQNPAITIQFLGGFRELCERGLIIHHLHRDFSLSPLGMATAKLIQREEVQEQLQLATEFGLHE